mmetsp:Transcript_18089/g.50650  ORF Transcript_18089/g.50650 Transcript_18089/m.50650 type:complete len:242 (-) Transcript_18089:840-1565(-)
MTRVSLRMMRRMSWAMAFAFCTSCTRMLMVSNSRHSLPLRVTLSTMFLEKTALGITNISRSKERMRVRYQPMSATMPSMTLLLWKKVTSSPTSKGFVDMMRKPLSRFSQISLPAKPMARPPIPPIASTEPTSRPMAWIPSTMLMTKITNVPSLSYASHRRCEVASPFISACHAFSLQKRDFKLNTTVANPMMKLVDRMLLTTWDTVALGMAIRDGRNASEMVHSAATNSSSSKGWYTSRSR